MGNFKKGDKVRVIPSKHCDTAAHLQIGVVYTVANKIDSAYVQLEGEHMTTFETRLELAPLEQAVAQRIDALAQGVRVTPEVYCACCHRASPRIVVPDHPSPGNMLGLSKQVNQPDLRGWLIIGYPYADPFIEPRVDGREYLRFGQKWEEVTKVCRKCALQVMGTVKHMSEGWRK